MIRRSSSTSSEPIWPAPMTRRLCQPWECLLVQKHSFNEEPKQAESGGIEKKRLVGGGRWADAHCLLPTENWRLALAVEDGRREGEERFIAYRHRIPPTAYSPTENRVDGGVV